MLMYFPCQQERSDPSTDTFPNAPQAHLAALSHRQVARVCAQQDTIAQREVRLRHRLYALYHLFARPALARQRLAPAQHYAQQVAVLLRLFARLALPRLHLEVILDNGLRILSALQPPSLQLAAVEGVAISLSLERVMVLLAVLGRPSLPCFESQEVRPFPSTLAAVALVDLDTTYYQFLLLYT